MEFYSRRSQEAEALLSAFLVNLLSETAFCLKEDSSFIYINPNTCRLLEYSDRELLSLTLLDIAVDLSLEMWSKKWQMSQRNGLTKFQCHLQTKSKQIFLTEMTLFWAKNHECEFACISISDLSQETLKTQNITPQSSDIINSLNLNQKISLLCNTFDLAACGFLAVNLEGKILNYNQRFLEMWQVKELLALSIYSQDFQNLFAPQLKNPPSNRQFVWETSSEIAEDSIDIIELNDGRVFVRYSKPQRHDEEIIGRIWSIWDITEIQQLIQTKDDDSRSQIICDRASEEAKALSELRTRFLSTVCHQFRSFLNIISFSNSLLRRNVVRETEIQKLPYLDNIQTAVEQISTLLDKLIFLGQSEVGKLKFEPKPTEIVSFCRDLTSQIEAISQSKQQTVEFSCQDNLGIVFVDGDLLEQILINLLSNAVKYTPKNGKIEFKLYLESEKLIFQIQDTGVGISKVEQQRIFEPFYRGSNIDDTSGMGLGLTIVRNLVHLHNGQIQVESQEGIGTTFTVTIPDTGMVSEISP